MPRTMINTADVINSSNTAKSAVGMAVDVSRSIGAVSGKTASEIKSRYGIGGRLWSAQSNVSQIASDISAICQAAENGALQYQNTESAVLNQARGMAAVQNKNGNPGNVSAYEAAFTMAGAGALYTLADDMGYSGTETELDITGRVEQISGFVVGVGRMGVALQTSGNKKEKPKSFGEKIVGGVGKAWGFLKGVWSSPPVTYAKEAIKDVGMGVVNVFSFCGNVVTGKWIDAGQDVYDLCNEVINFSQDLSAVAVYGIGSLPFWNKEQRQYCYDFAKNYSELDGIAGQLREDGLEGGAIVVEAAEGVMDLYDTVTTLDKLNNFRYSYLADNLTIKEVFDFGGWKLIKGDDVVNFTEKVQFYADYAKNCKTAYEYAEGLAEGKLVETVVEKTYPGKVIKGVTDFVEHLTNISGDINTMKAKSEAAT